VPQALSMGAIRVELPSRDDHAHSPSRPFTPIATRGVVLGIAREPVEQPPLHFHRTVSPFLA